MGYVLLFALVVAIFWHGVLPKFVWATVWSTISATLLVWLMTSSHFGWLDETFFKNLALTLTISLTASLIVGVGFLRWRRTRAQP